MASERFPVFQPLASDANGNSREDPGGLVEMTAKPAIAPICFLLCPLVALFERYHLGWSFK